MSIHDDPVIANDPATGLLRRPPAGGPQDIFYLRTYATHFPTIARGEGIYLWDESGARYIDAIAGAMVSNLGQGNARVADAMARQAKELTFTYVRYARHRPNIELARKVSALAGPGYERCFFVSGGSEANDMAIKFLRQYAYANGQTEKTHIISLMPSYHGSTLGTIAMTGNEDLEPLYGPMVQFSTKIPAPLSYRLAPGQTAEDAAMETVRALEEAILRIGPERTLAFILEPIGGVATGAVTPPAVYYREIRRICSQYGVYVIFDEVITALRSGRFLAAQYWADAQPDLVVLAKGLGAGYAPLGAILAPAAMVDPLADHAGFNVSHTYSANPVACAGGIAVLDETIERDLIGNAERTGAYLKTRLEELKERSPIVGDVRGRGLLCAVELVSDKATKRVFPSSVYVTDRLRIVGLRHGLILYARRQSGGKYGEWSMITPPLIITREQVDELVERFERALNELTEELHAEGVL
ncbi:MAG: aminotransferase class III-fold pyridoxal phosphate-dependent enzyme [Methanothrix sp.]|nr:aminotransferase class III-fold pyridoxal phosphate-dependent enzyme [Methanothrix sp.]